MYTGITELMLDNESIASLYEKKFIPDRNININEYLIIKNIEGEIIDKGRWTESGFVKLKYKPIKNDMFGKFSPKNLEQEFAFDALQNDGITGVLLLGGFGSGKTMMCLVHALEALNSSKSKINQIVFLRNNIQTRNTQDVGALPNSLVEKIKPYAMPLADILGSEIKLDELIGDERIKLDHIGFIRGRSYKNSIVFLSEAENVDKQIMSIVVGRIGEGSRLFVEGDINQWDKEVFRKESGVVAMAEQLKGDYEFGMVTLKKNERSRFASLSDRLLQ